MISDQNINKYEALSLTIFKSRNLETFHLLSNLNFLKLPDKSVLENGLLISKTINNISRSLFNTWFTFHQRHITVRHHP